MTNAAEQTVRPTCVHENGYEHPAITKDGGQFWSTCDHAALWPLPRDIDTKTEKP